MSPNRHYSAIQACRIVTAGASSMAEVGAQLHISVATVNSHKGVVLSEKFGPLPPTFWE